MAVLINGIKLDPQPAAVAWATVATGTNLDGTESLGAYREVTLSAPAIHDTLAFNWSDFENEVLTSITVPAPGKSPEDQATTYNSGAVSKAIKAYNSPVDRMVRGVSLTCLVVV